MIFIMLDRCQNNKNKKKTEVIKMGQWLQKYLTKIMQCLSSLFCISICKSYQWHCFVYLSVQASLLCYFNTKNTKWKCFLIRFNWSASATIVSFFFSSSHTEANQYVQLNDLIWIMRLNQFVFFFGCAYEKLFTLIKQIVQNVTKKQNLPPRLLNSLGDDGRLKIEKYAG